MDEGKIYCLDLNNFNFSKEKVFKMVEKLFNNFDKIKHHSINCGKKDCKFCKKFLVMLTAFLKYEEKYEEIDIEEMKEEIEEEFFSDNLIKILN